MVLGRDGVGCRRHGRRRGSPAQRRLVPLMAHKSLKARIERDGLWGAGVAGQQTGSKSLLEGSGRPERPRQHSGATPDVLEAVWYAMTEHELQGFVEDALTNRGYIWWHVVDPRLMRAGLPDIIAVHPTREPRRVLFWELKTMRGKVTDKQADALRALRRDIPGVDARLVRPSDLTALLEDL